jgi:DNA ligase-1
LLKKRVRDSGVPELMIVDHQTIQDQAALDLFEHDALARGYEGVMLRSPGGPYKNGRSTEREGYLLKLKRFEDAEARIVGYEELDHNANEKGADGKRTSHKAGKVPMGRLGALKVIGVAGTYDSVAFNIGTGFDDEARDYIWKHQKEYLGHLVKFSYFPTGSKDAPRFPVFLGFRDARDC